ncbi:unnamed protein product [Moneuplotes crassus]|uniref:Sec23/Sec24 trunk domain-containing protein n=3 Tax=Euplotes crassus TaxID=5936 RepID=A0AAD1Y7Y4_EUPCR|nr:unnamed protein product [Moneuplotes crassus]
MDFASSNIFIRKAKKEVDDAELEDYCDKLSVCSDELNRSFDSDEDEEEVKDQKDLNDGLQMIDQRSSKLSNEAHTFGAGSWNAMDANIDTAVPKMAARNMAAPKKKSGGFFKGLMGIFSKKKNEAELDIECCMDAGSPMMNSKPKRAAKVAKSRVNRQGRKFQNEVDTNVISLSLKVLKEDAELAAGDPIFCEKCNAVFNVNSKLDEKEKKLEQILEVDEEDKEEDMVPNEREEVKIELGEGEELWNCEFCNHKNIIFIEKEEIPKKDAINYIIDNEELDENKKHSGEASVIFCIDISGSMCVTKAVDGKFKIKGDKYDELQELMKYSDGSDQFAFNDRNMTYVSRLQCVQAAIEAQLIDMKVEKSQKKVGLVSFNGEVNIVGDGSQPSQTISGDKLTNYEYLIENGQNVAKTHMSQGIEESSDQLNEKLFALEETGPTALGPAVASSIAMAGECGNGSQVFICTDGLANVGVGCLEEQKDNTNAEQDVATFYEQLADYAASKGVTVNIISIKGEECDLETLRPLYDKTNGNVDIIEPDELKNNFANMMKQEVIATRVVVKVKLHKALEFRNEDEKDLSNEKTILTRDVGNVTEDSEITFEYRVKDQKDLEKLDNFDISKIDQIPFQTIIEYTKLDGMKCIRTITKVQKVTDDAAQMKKDVNIEVLAVNAAQQASKLATRGQFREAQAYSMNQKRYLKSHLKDDTDKKMYSNWRGQMNGLYSDMHMQNNCEEMCEMQAESEGSSAMHELKRKKGFFSKLGDQMTTNVQKKKKFTKKSLW